MKTGSARNKHKKDNKTVTCWISSMPFCLWHNNFLFMQRWEAPPFSNIFLNCKKSCVLNAVFSKASIWLVVYLPLWNIWKPVGMMTCIIGKNLPNHQPGMYSKEPCTLEMMCFLRIKETTLVVKKYDTCSIETASLKGICDCCFHGNRRFIFPRYAHILLGLLHPFNQKCGMKKRVCLFNVAFQGKMYSSTVK